MNVPFAGLRPLKIGNVAIDLPLILAPMAGITDLPFRLLCKRFGAGLVFTEVAAVEGIVRRTPKTLHFLASLPEERPIAAHIYGADPDSLARAAAVIESLGQFDLVDINCGCPVRKIVRHGAGVALMRDPGKIKTIVQAVRQATALPVTVKTRLGLSPQAFNVSEVAQAAEEGGAGALFVHARFASDKHVGPVHLEALQRVKQERKIPVIGNGGVTDGADAAEMLRQTGVDGVMIGRGAIGNPWIFKQIGCHLQDMPYTPPSQEERREVIVEHLNAIHTRISARRRAHSSAWQRTHAAGQAELAACRHFRAYLLGYLAGVDGVGELRRRLDSLNSIAAVLDAVDHVLTKS